MSNLVLRIGQVGRLAPSPPNSLGRWRVGVNSGTGPFQLARVGDRSCDRIRVYLVAKGATDETARLARRICERFAWR